jgi:hypothetical protein
VTDDMPSDPVPPARQQDLRREAKAVVCDWILTALTVLLYLTSGTLALLAAWMSNAGTYAAFGPLFAGSMALGLVAHKPHRHGTHRAKERAEDRARRDAEWHRRWKIQKRRTPSQPS